VEGEGKEEAAAAAVVVAKEEALALPVVVDLLRHILSGRLLMTLTVSRRHVPLRANGLD
jgi:hypothetical protein